jgi:hypothetical protein
MSRQYRIVYLAIKRAYKKVVRLCRQSIEAVGHGVSFVGLNLASHYRRAQIDGKDFYKSFATRCRQTPEALRLQMSKTGLKIEKGYHRTGLVLKRNVARPCRKGVEAIGHGATVVGLNIASLYRRAQIDGRDFVKSCRKAPAAARQELVRKYTDILTKVQKMDEASQRKTERELRSLANARKRVTSSCAMVGLRGWMGLTEIGKRISSSIKVSKSRTSKIPLVASPHLDQSEKSNKDLWITPIDATLIIGAAGGKPWGYCFKSVAVRQIRTEDSQLGRIKVMGDLLDHPVDTIVRGSDTFSQMLGLNLFQEEHLGSFQQIGVELELV